MKTANPTLIGGFLVGALLLGVLAVLISGGARAFQHQTRAVIYFEDPVTGLSVGSPVTFRGVPVGQVTDIRVQFSAKDLSARIPVYIALDPHRVSMSGDERVTVADVPLKKFLEKGLRARLTSQSLVTGQLEIELDFQPDTPALLATSDAGNEVPALRSGSPNFLDELSRLPLNETVTDLRQTMLAIRELAVNANSQLNDTAGSLRQTSEEVRRAVARVQVDASHTLRSFQTLGDHADGAIESLSPQLTQTLLTAQKALDEADTTLAHTSDMTAPDASIRSNLNEVLRNLAVASEALRSFSETIDRNPNALLIGKPKK